MNSNAETDFTNDIDSENDSEFETESELDIESNIVNLQHAILYGLPKDGGLWVPQYIPTI